ncbi:MAG: SpoIIE family protein phosphatase [Akkermansia sp.]
MSFLSDNFYQSPYDMFNLKYIKSIGNQSFARKINTLILFLLLGIFLLISIIIGINWSHIHQRNIISNGETVTQRAVARMDKSFNHAECIGRIYAEHISHGPFSSDQLSGITADFKTNITKFLDMDPCIVGATIAFAPDVFQGESTYNLLDNSTTDNGSFFTSSKEDSYTESSWYKQAEKAIEPFWIPPFQFRNSGGLSSCYAVPIRTKSTQQFIGVILVEFSLAKIQEELLIFTVNGEGFTFLFSPTGQYIVYPNKTSGQELYDTITNTTNRNDNQQEDLMKIQSGMAGHIKLSNFPSYPNGAFIFYAPCQNKWIAALALPGDLIQSKITSLCLQLGTIFFISAVVITLCIYALTLHISRPLRKLSEAAKKIGEGNFDIALPTYAGHDEIALLTQSFAEMQSKLTLYMQELQNNNLQKKHLDMELNAAKTIQMGTLPKLKYPFSGCDDFKIDAILYTAKEVGGDLYDFFLIDEDHLVVVIGDVSGKGIPAALFMTVTQSLQRSITTAYSHPGAIVTELNASLSINNEAEMFVTYFMGILNIKTGVMKYCNAGHCPPYIRKASGDLVCMETTHGLPLAIIPAQYQYSEICLAHGDTLILYTDGVTEAFNDEDEMFEPLRLKEAISCALSSDPSHIIDTIISHINDFIQDHEQSDDTTILALTWTHQSQPNQ